MTKASNVHHASHMRALAHPTRLKLLALLREQGPQTAALLAQHVDEAPGSLSYHLRKLADAGYAEEATGIGTDGRERWWRASHEATVWDTSEFLSNPERLAAQREMFRAIGQAYADRLAAYIESAANIDPEWVAAGFISDRALQLTPAQLAELSREFEALQSRWVAVSESNADSSEAAAVFLLGQAYKRP